MPAQLLATHSLSVFSQDRYESQLDLQAKAPQLGVLSPFVGRCMSAKESAVERKNFTENVIHDAPWFTSWMPALGTIFASTCIQTGSEAGLDRLLSELQYASVRYTKSYSATWDSCKEYTDTGCNHAFGQDDREATSIGDPTTVSMKIKDTVQT